MRVVYLYKSRRQIQTLSVAVTSKDISNATSSKLFKGFTKLKLHISLKNSKQVQFIRLHCEKTERERKVEARQTDNAAHVAANERCLQPMQSRIHIIHNVFINFLREDTALNLHLTDLFFYKTQYNMMLQSNVILLSLTSITQNKSTFF